MNETLDGNRPPIAKVEGSSSCQTSKMITSRGSGSIYESKL
jgi:hypothetical protein